MSKCALMIGDLSFFQVITHKLGILSVSTHIFLFKAITGDRLLTWFAFFLSLCYHFIRIRNTAFCFHGYWMREKSVPSF